MKKINNILIYDNFIGIKCFSTLLLEILPGVNIFSFQNTESIDLAGIKHDNNFLNFINISSNDRYILNLIESGDFKENIIITSDIPINLYYNRFSKLNVIGYIDRNNFNASTISDLINKISQNKVYLTDSDRDLLLGLSFNKSNLKDSNPLNMLSIQEYNIMQRLLSGKSISEIAIELNLHKSSISTYKQRLFSKLSVKNLLELNIIANKS